MERGPADRLLDKLRRLVAEELDDEERALFAALIAPGIAQAHADTEVEAFALDWSPATLPAELAQAIRDRQVRIDGL